VIIVQTPLRVSLFGGGTDFPSYFLKEGGCVLTAAIDKYIFITVKRRFDNLLRVGYTKTEMVTALDEIQHELFREALRLTGIHEAVEINSTGDIPSAGTGLGSSSTVTVGTLHALYTLMGEIVPAERLAREACEIELKILGKPIGVQDQYIAAYGGLRFIEFHRDGLVSIQKVVMDAASLRRLNENLLLFFTGTERRADLILKEQVDNIAERGPILKQMAEMAVIARQELIAGNVDAIGELLHEAWTLKKQLASRITNGSIDELYSAAIRAGALGGKITGAGGGGFLLFYCHHDKQDAVRSTLQLKELPFQLEPDGSKVIFNYKR
jgi:D-glycero-alpha-D-manno-heptose-7-phosphate kinase